MTGRKLDTKIRDLSLLLTNLARVKYKVDSIYLKINGGKKLFFFFHSSTFSCDKICMVCLIKQFRGHSHDTMHLPERDVTTT